MGELSADPPPPPPKDIPHPITNRPQSGSWGTHYDDPHTRSRILSKLKPCPHADMSVPQAPPLDTTIHSTPSTTYIPIDMTPIEPLAPSGTLRKKYPPGGGIWSIGRFFKALGKHHDQSSSPPPPPPKTEAAAEAVAAVPGVTTIKTTARSPTVSTTSSHEDAPDAVVVVQKHSTLNDVSSDAHQYNGSHRDRPDLVDDNKDLEKPSGMPYDSSDHPGNESNESPIDETSQIEAVIATSDTVPSHGVRASDDDGPSAGLITNDQSDNDEENGTAMTSESESVAIVTPPAQSMTENDKVDSDSRHEYLHLASDTARRIWEQDPTVYEDLEHITEWIGNGKPMSMCILRQYFLFFDFTNTRLDEAFRTLCSKLHLKAEAQQIDRVLEEFAKRYWDCNPFSIYGNPDVVHAIVYSLVLLNTDLHVAQGDHRKMSRSAFVRNTTNAVSIQCRQQLGANSSESTISEVDESRTSSMTLEDEDHKLKRSHSCKSSTSTSGSSITRHYPYEVPSMTPMTLTFGSKAWYGEIENLLREMYISIRNHEILNPSLTAQQKNSNTNGTGNGSHFRHRNLQGSSGTRVGGAFKRSVGTIMLKAGRASMVLNEEPTDAQHRSMTPVSERHQRSASVQSNFSQGSSHLSHASTNYQAVASLLHHSELPPSYTSAAPYYKEGLLVRKHLLERAGTKSRHRDWKECFLVVDRGEMRMYRLDNSSRHDLEPLHNHQQRRTGIRTSMMLTRAHQDLLMSQFAATAVGGGDWLASAESLGMIDLKHTLSNAQPSGYSPQRPHAFALQQSNGGVYVFQAGSSEQVAEWVSTCNYWAARESKEPLTGGVSSMEYGWCACLEEDIATKPPVPTVYEWVPPAPPSVTSSLGEKAQLEALGRHIRKLSDDLDEHRDIKEKMEQRFSGCMRSSQAIRAMANWESKSQYLLHEIIKYQNYHDAIEQSLALQDEAIKKMNDTQ